MLFRSALALLLVAPLPWTIQQACAQSSHSIFQQIHKISDNVHVLIQPLDHHWTSVSGNITIIEQSDGFVLVDSGGSTGDGRRLVQHIKALSSKPVKAIVLSHWHDDHPLGLPPIMAEWPRARIISTELTKRGILNEAGKRWPLLPDEAKDLENRQNTITYIERMKKSAVDTALTASERRDYSIEAEGLSRAISDTDGTYIIPPNETFETKLVLDDPVAPVEVMFLGRANTDGDAVAWLPRQRIVVTGDVVVSPIPFSYGSSYPTEWKSTLAKVKALNFAVLIPGHGTPQRDSSYIDALIEAIEDVQTQVVALDQRGVPADQIRAKVDFTRQETRFAGNDPWRVRLLRSYWQGIADCVYREVKGLTIVEAQSCAPPKATAVAPGLEQQFRASNDSIVASRGLYKGRPATRVLDRTEPSALEPLVLLPVTDFRNGAIEADVAGLPALGAFEGARGFIGIAFRVQQDPSRYEAFYIRPTNGRAEDQLRRNRATQYIGMPDYPWDRLRKEHPGVYESYADMVPGEWTRLRIEVDGVKARLFVGDSKQPALIVNDLKLGANAAGGVALWAGPGTDGYFSNVKVTKAAE